MRLYFLNKPLYNESLKYKPYIDIAESTNYFLYSKTKYFNK